MDQQIDWKETASKAIEMRNADIVHRYTDLSQGALTISKALGIGTTLVFRVLREKGVTTRSRGRPVGSCTGPLT